ncbi:iron-sulfur cluster insertion protein ErpA [Rickettsiella endosymbiont of Xylota segnis]|uniref:iron-sulfur cluster insertion protein ErpA n=1 Tax=Rickettsiella endosymbiont of Xylota segnis TaxID=3066238 RepID=UPI0030CDADDD
MSEILSQQNLVSETSFPEIQPITLTENAARKIGELIAEEENLQLKLRVFITGGGCSGFQYGFSFDETINEDDTLISKTIATKDAEDCDFIKVQLLVDPMSLVYLVGAEIDYKSDLTGEQFIIRNPNAKTTCGCGSSFVA